MPSGRDSQRTGAIIEARALGRRGDDGWLVRGVDLAIAAGDRIALSGPSGAGKTILLRALALLDPLDAGEVLLDGSPVAAAAIPGYRCRVTYLHQAPALAEGSVESNLELPFSLARHRQRGYDRARALALLAKLGKDERFLRRERADLSGGEAQLVALARLLQLEPEVLLLDEPTAALDPESAKRAQALLRQWQTADRRRAYLWVTHDARLGARVGDRRLTLGAGGLEEAA